jgi:hypothetical protein
MIRMTLSQAPAIVRCSAWSMLLAAALLAPFWNKAFTIDDPTFLAGAEQVLRDPLHPSAFEMVWGSTHRERASAMYQDTPVAYVLLVPTILADGVEWVAHLTWFLLLACGIVGTVALALRMGYSERQAKAAALLLAGTPCVLAMAGTAMPDIPSMTFGVFAAERLLAFKQNGRWHQGVSAAVFLLMGIFCRPHLVLMAGAGAVLLWDNEAQSETHNNFRAWLFRLWPLALAMVAMFGLVRLMRDPLNQIAGAFQGPLHFASTTMAAQNVISFLTHWMLVVPLAIPWLIVRRRKLSYSMLPGIGVILGAAVFFLPTVPWWTVPIAALSGLALFDILLDGWDRRDFAQLFLFAWLLIPLAALPYIHLPAKYLVACAPAAALLVAARISMRLTRIVVGAGALLGVLILSADAKLTGVWRDGAAKLIAPRVRAGEKVWFAGSWGYYWYAEKAGAQVLSLTPPFPGRGDIVVVNSSYLRNELDVVSKYTEIEQYEDATPGGRIFGGFGGAGFYSNYFGYLPWTYGDDAITRFVVLRVD